MGTFQMPQFNFRLRRALNPFESKLTPRSSYSPKNPWDVDMYNPQEQESIQPSEPLPNFSNAMPDFQSLYGETGPATRQYQTHLGQIPRMENYAPSRWRRFGSVLMGGLAGMNGDDAYGAAENFNRAPYNNAYKDWANSGQGLKESATLEEASMGKKAALHQKILSDFMEQQKWEMDFKIRMRNARTGEERNEITREYNQMRNESDAVRNRIYGDSVKQTGNYQNNMVGLGRDRLDQGERNMFHESIQGSLERASREKIAGMRGDTGVSGSEQDSIKQQAYRASVAELADLGLKPEEYFMSLGNILVPINRLPPEIQIKVDAWIAQGQKTAIGGGRR